MDRQQLDQDLVTFCEQKAAQHKQEADDGADDYLPEKDRRNRPNVLGPLCRVKGGDDVLHNGLPVRVIGPAREEGWFYGLEVARFGPIDVPMEGQYITDRAPADPTEEPLPVFIEDEPAPVDSNETPMPVTVPEPETGTEQGDEPDEGEPEG